LSITVIVIFGIGAILAVTLHEMGHAYAAWWMGDDTAQKQGRLSPNPLKHMDPIGTVLVPGFLLFSGAPFLFGWAKPVPFVIEKLRHPRLGMMFVAIMGPVANLLLCFVATFLLWAFVPPSGPSDVGYALLGVLKLNVLLMCFNLLPIPPLDGGHVLQQLAPRRFEPYVRQLQSFGILIVLAFVFLGVFRTILGFIINAMFYLIALGFGTDFVYWLTAG
jgi:Zn-dependent protease